MIQPSLILCTEIRDYYLLSLIMYYVLLSLTNVPCVCWLSVRFVSWSVGRSLGLS